MCGGIGPRRGLDNGKMPGLGCRQMVRVLVPVVVFAAVAAGCGRSTPYTYPPGQGPRLTPPDLPLPDGGVVPFMPVTPDGGPQCKPVESDMYTLPPTDKRPIDVLFVVDDSASMKNDQDALAANFASFIASFKANSVDFHLGVVTTDMAKSTKQGRLEKVNGKTFLTPADMTTLETDFATLVRVGTEGSPDEKCLAAAKAALSSPLIDAAKDGMPAGANVGFLRPEADLGIVFVGDEDDHDKATVQSYVDFFKGLKTDQAAVSVSAIALQNGILCSTATWRMVQTARGFGPRGLVSSCTPDYASTLKAIGGRLLDSHCVIGLKRWLEEGAKVHVLVNGQNSSFIPFPPDEAYANGSIQVLTCPASGGTVELVYEECLETL